LNPRGACTPNGFRDRPVRPLRHPSATDAQPSRGAEEQRLPRVPGTERAGFEPATHLSARTRFPVALLRPLGHLSVWRADALEQTTTAVAARRGGAPCRMGYSSSPPRRGGRAVECGGLENRYPSLGGSRVQIPPPPLEQAKNGPIPAVSARSRADSPSSCSARDRRNPPGGMAQPNALLRPPRRPRRRRPSTRQQRTPKHEHHPRQQTADPSRMSIVACGKPNAVCAHTSAS
jgi:hypothetical protein